MSGVFLDWDGYGTKTSGTRPPDTLLRKDDKVDGSNTLKQYRLDLLSVSTPGTETQGKSWTSHGRRVGFPSGVGNKSYNYSDYCSFSKS